MHGPMHPLSFMSDCHPSAATRHAAIGWLFVTTVLWSISFVLMRAMGLSLASLAPGADSFSISCVSVAIRYGLSALTILVLWRGVGGITGREWRQGAWLGFFHGAGLLLQADGLAHTDASISAFLTQCYCVLVPLYCAVRDRVAPGGRALFSIVLVMVGVGILAHVDWNALRLGRGEAETLLCSVFFTAQILCLEHPRFRGNRTMPITCVMCGSVALLLLPLVGCFPPPAGVVSAILCTRELLPLMAGLVLFSTVGANLLMNRWQHAVTGTEASLIYSTEPVYASLFALFVPSLLSSWSGIDYVDEHVTCSLVLGGGLMLAANVLMQWRRV